MMRLLPQILLAALTWTFLGNVIAGEGRHALIIGIGQFSEASNTKSLEGVPKDMVNARIMAKEMGIPDDAIVMLRDDQATKANIQKEYKKLAEKVQLGDRVFIYHSGHGTRYQKGNNCLQGLQTYTEGKFTYDDILTEEELAAYTTPISEKADKVMVLIDACFSGGVLNSSTRSLNALLDIQAKFNANSEQKCENVGVNQTVTRGLLSELKRLGAYEENFVQIAAANDNEVSWDSKDLGGLATHTLTQCLTGGASDLNGSGAISLEEVRACAQAKLNALMKPHERLGLLPSTIQIKGNRNLIPVAIQRPPVDEVVAQIPVIQEPPPDNPVPPNSSEQPKPPANMAVLAPVAVVAVPIITQPVITTPPLKIQPEAVKPTSPVKPVQLPPKPLTALNRPPIEPAIASMATLKDIEQQRNPKRQVDVKVGKPAMRIGKDSLELTIKSSHDGFVYLVLLGSDAKSFYVLYPNGLDKDNQIKAGKSLQLPKPDWQIKAAGPVGTNNVLVMVSDSPRKLDNLTMAAPTANEPFTYALNDMGGRSALVNFLTGTGIDGRSESFGAKLISIKEVQ